MTWDELLDDERTKLLLLGRRMEDEMKRMAAAHHNVAVAVAARADLAAVADALTRFGAELDELAGRIGDFTRALDVEVNDDAVA